MIYVNQPEIRYEGEMDVVIREAIGALLIIYDECDDELIRFKMLNILKSSFEGRFNKDE